MSSNEMDTTPDKAALVSVLNYLRTKKLKDTEDALRKELSLLGQADYTDLSSQSLEISSLGSSGTEPSKYEESYSGSSLTTPSTSTMTDLQSASTEDTPSNALVNSTDTIQDNANDEDPVDPDHSTLEASSYNPLPNLLEIPSSRPACLTLNSISADSAQNASPVQSPVAESVTSSTSDNSPFLTGFNDKRSNSEHRSVKSPPVVPRSPPQFAMGSPLLYQVGAGGRPTVIGRQVLTPILTVLPPNSLINPITAAALQAGGQPIIFSTSQAPKPQVTTNAKPQQISSPSTSVNRLSSPVELSHNTPSVGSPPRTLASLMLSEMTPQYLELKNFAEEFKTKRIRLGYTQGAVGQSLAEKGFNNFAQSTISRFEQLQLSPANAAAIKQVLEKWLQEAEYPNSQPSSVSGSSSSVGPIMNCRKRKKRAVFTVQTRNTLEEFFRQNPRPNRQLIESIASELGLLPEEVRVWFCNKRQKSKQSQSVGYDRESSVSTSSFVDSPPSFFDKVRSPSPKTPYTIEELSKSSASMTTTPSQSTSPVQLSTLGLVRPLSSTGLYPMVFNLPPSPPQLLSTPVAQTTA